MTTTFWDWAGMSGVSGEHTVTMEHAEIPERRPKHRPWGVQRRCQAPSAQFQAGELDKASLFGVS